MLEMVFLPTAPPKTRIDKMCTVVATHFQFFTRKILIQPTQLNCHRAERLIGLCQLGWLAWMSIFHVETHIFLFISLQKSHYHKNTLIQPSKPNQTVTGLNG